MDDKPSFEKEPFDADVEADEDTDPKKFIQQLSGKLGQSLRKYQDETGTPDLELEKFAINSVVSATHTSQMSDDDKKDIIKKIENAGSDGGGDSESNDDISNQDNDENMGDSNEDGENFEESLKIKENNRTFVKNNIMDRQTCDCDIDSIVNEIIGDETVEPIVKPSIKPNIKPSRRSKPFKVPIILPEHSPKPKAIIENKIALKPQNIWWENDPDTLLKVTCWYKNELIPSDINDRKKSFTNIANKLNSKYESPSGEIDKLINMIK